MQIISKAHKAEKEIYAFVGRGKRDNAAGGRKCWFSAFIKEIASDAGVINFFKSAGHLKGPRIAGIIVKTYNPQLIMDLPLSAVVDYLIYAIEQEKNRAWELLETNIDPFMALDMAQTY